MTRGRKPQPWMKLHGSFLDSSINYEMELDQQCVFLKICLFSMRCGMDAGFIADNDGKSIPVWYIANCIHAPVEVVEETIRIGKETQRIRENGTGILEIVNWKHYQSEYERQKPYRQDSNKDNLLPIRVNIKKSENAAKTWDSVLAIIKESINKSNYSTYFKDTVGVAEYDSEFVICVRELHCAEYIYNNQKSIIEKYLHNEVGRKLSIAFMVQS